VWRTGRLHRSSLFPYTTLFRSNRLEGKGQRVPRDGLSPLPVTNGNLSGTGAVPRPFNLRLSAEVSRSSAENQKNVLTYRKLKGRSEEHTSELKSRVNL